MVEIVGRLGALEPSGGIHEQAVAVEKMRARILRHGAGDGLERSRQIILVGVQPADEVAGGHAEALVERVRLALVGLGDPAQVRITAEHCERAIARAAVHHDVLEIRIALAEHAQDGVFEIMPVVETGGDDGNFRRLRHSVRAVQTLRAITRM